MHINYTDSHPFNEIQIIHYGAICEAILGSIFKTNSVLKQHKETDRIGTLTKLGVISIDLETDIRTLWEIRNNVHLHKAKATNEKFFKKTLANTKGIILDFYMAIECYINTQS